MLKKIISIFLISVFVISVMSFPAAAADTLTAEESNAQIAEMAAAIEKKFGVGITYGFEKDGYASISKHSLETLDLALSSLTPGFVRQLSQYYRDLNGRRITFEYVVSNSTYDYAGGTLMASFEQEISKVSMYIPSYSGKAIISGENPIALVHELGHAFSLMLMDLYGRNQLEREWASFNGGYTYNSKLGFTNPDSQVFISSYATTSFEEDFSEVFGHVFIRSNPGQGFRNRLSVDSQWTGLGQKVRYIEMLISKFVTNPEPVLENYRRIYTTPSAIMYEDIKFSGDYLQYIGYPQPKNILKGMLNGLKIKSEKTTWVRNLGAWRVYDETGKMYFIFPGGSWASVDSRGRIAA